MLDELPRSSTGKIFVVSFRTSSGPCVGAGPLLRAVARTAQRRQRRAPVGREGYITLPVFSSAGRRPRSPLFSSASVLDAVRRGLAATSGPRGRIALVLTAIAWALLWLIYRRNVVSATHFEEPLRDALGDDYEEIAAQSQPARRRRTPQIGVWPNELIRRRYVEKAGTVQYGPHRRVNRADIWRRADLPRDGKAPVLLQVPGGAWAIGMRRPQAYPHAGPSGSDRGMGVRVDRTIRVEPPCTRGRTTSSTPSARWRGVRENIAGLRRGSRISWRSAGGSAGGHLCALAAPDSHRPSVAARLRGGRHVGGGGGAVLRPLRLVSPPRAPGRAEFVAVLEKTRGQAAAQPRTGRCTWTRRRSSGYARADAPPFFAPARNLGRLA